MDADERTPQQWLKRLNVQHQAEVGDLELLDDHYEGAQQLSYMAPELLAELGDRVRQVVMPWPELVVGAVEERLDIEGFRLGGEDKADEDLHAIWQANDLDESSSQGHIDAMVMRRAYGIVGDNDEDGDLPIITIESPLEVYAERDPRTRKVIAAAKWWQEQPEDKGRVSYATLYLPNETSFWRRESGVWVPADDEHETIEHGWGVVPVEEFVNRPRLARRDVRPYRGVSELASLLPISDAACKIATDMMVSGEFHAMPRRYVLNAAEEDFQDQQGRPVSALSRLAGRIWAFTRGKADGVEVGQFPEANLTNFHDTIRLLASVVASIAGLPPSYLGLTSDNPASADAIRALEARLIKRAERKQRAFGGSWERLMRIALLVRDGEIPDEALRMETQWRDAATPTKAQAADAATKLYQAGLIPKRQTRRDLGYTDPQIRDMEAEDEKAVEQILGPGGDLAAATAKVPVQGGTPAPAGGAPGGTPAGTTPAPGTAASAAPSA